MFRKLFSGRRKRWPSRAPTRLPAPKPSRKMLSTVPKVKAVLFTATSTRRNQRISRERAQNPLKA